MKNEKAIKVKFLTFNGLALTGKGKNRDEAKMDAQKQAKDLGTCLRRAI